MAKGNEGRRPTGALACALAAILAGSAPGQAQDRVPSPAHLAVQQVAAAGPGSLFAAAHEVQLELRYERATRAVRAGGVLMAIGLLSFGAGVASAYAHAADPCGDGQGAFCLEFGPGMSAAAALLVTAPILVGGGITLGIGVRRRRAVLAELDYGFALAPGGFSLRISF